MKKFLKLSVAAVAAGTAAVLAGCGGCTSCAGCAGCSGDVKNLTVTGSNWYTGTSYKGIQPSFIEGHEKFSPEILEYDVSFIAPTAGNTTYSVDYKDGSYKTEFYATAYDWNANPVYPSENTETVYCFKAVFKIKVQYTFKLTGETSEWFDDSVTTVSYFRAAGKNLAPVYSRQEICSTSPANYQAASVSDTYSKVNVNYDNYYDYECSEVTTFTKKDGGDRVKGEPYSFNKLKLSIFDNSSLYIAVRSMKLSPSMSANINLYSAAAGGVSSYSVAGQTTSMNDEELKTVTQVMTEGGLFAPENDDSRIPAVAMNVNYTGGNLYGTTQTIWYASVEKPDNNASRAVMLKMTIPLSYSLGTLNYTLKEVTSTLWNG